jgi:uncharacterized protein YfaQ (DUF2300 family)
MTHDKIIFWTLAAVWLNILAGCAQLQTAVPSLQHCEHVSYIRDGIKFHIEAECQL